MEKRQVELAIRSRRLQELHGPGFARRLLKLVEQNQLDADVLDDIVVAKERSRRSPQCPFHQRHYVWTNRVLKSSSHQPHKVWVAVRHQLSLSR
jgi:hypothetical protein